MDHEDYGWLIMNGIEGYGWILINGMNHRFKYTLKIEDNQLWLYFNEQEIAIALENDRVELSDIRRINDYYFSCITHPRFLVLGGSILIYQDNTLLFDQLERFISTDWKPYSGDWEFGTIISNHPVLLSINHRKLYNHVLREILILNHRKLYNHVLREILILNHRKLYNNVLWEIKNKFKPVEEKKKGWFSWLW
jgi:hypothetical protein